MPKELFGSDTVATWFDKSRFYLKIRKIGPTLMQFRACNFSEVGSDGNQTHMVLCKNIKYTMLHNKKVYF